MIKRIMLLIISICLFSCDNSDQSLIEDIEVIELVCLPLDLNLREALRDEQGFDNHISDYKDTFIFSSKNLSINLGEELTGYSRIDMRVKAILKNSDDKKYKLFISSTKRVMFNGKFYRAPPNLMNFVYKADSMNIKRLKESGRIR